MHLRCLLQRELTLSSPFVLPAQGTELLLPTESTSPRGFVADACFPATAGLCIQRITSAADRG